MSRYFTNVVVHVTAADIAAGRKSTNGNIEGTPVWIALKRMFKDDAKIFLEPQGFRLFCSSFDLRWNASPAVLDFILQFDQDEPVKPIRFELKGIPKSILRRFAKCNHANPAMRT